MAGKDETDDALTDAARRLYAAAPEEFMATRTELARSARADGDPETAGRIEKLRKPSVAAWIVNAYVLDEPDAVGRLGELGERMRAAQERFDAAELRDLTTERRRLVAELTKGAFARAGKRQPAAGLRDEVSGTFDAALADADVAARLGRLTRSEQWSGFGFSATGTPQLTVVHGGQDAGPGRSKAPAGKPKRLSAAERRKLEKAYADAQHEFDAAEEAYEQAQQGERDLAHRIKQLTERVAKMQAELETVRADLEAARRETSEAKVRRRDARSALMRADRAMPD